MNISPVVMQKVFELLTPFFQFLTEDYTSASPTEREEKSNQVRLIAAPASTAITLLPIGPVDAVGITFVQLIMVRAIGNIYSQPNCRISGDSMHEWISSTLISSISVKSIKEMVTVMGAGWLGQQVCLLIFRLVTWYIPGYMVGIFVGTWTAMIGKGAEKYYKNLWETSVQPT